MALLSVLNHISPKGNPLIPNLQMKSEAFLLLVIFSTVPAIPPSPPETSLSSCGPLSHTTIEEPKPGLFQGISLIIPSSSTPPQHWLQNTPGTVGTTGAFLQKAWRNHHQQDSICCCWNQAQPSCGTGMTRGWGALALVLPVLCSDSKCLRCCPKSSLHQSIINFWNQGTFSNQTIHRFSTLNISTSLVVWTFSAVKWVLDEVLGPPSSPAKPTWCFLVSRVYISTLLALPCCCAVIYIRKPCFQQNAFSQMHQVQLHS